MKKIVGILLLLSITAIYAITQTGTIYIIVQNQPPVINNVLFQDSSGNIVNKTNIQIANSAGNLKHYYLVINVTDQNTLQDIDKIIVKFKTPECNAPNEQCYLQFVYNSSGVFKQPSSPEFNVNLIQTPNLSNTNGIYKFDITFPKVAKRYKNYNWSIEVEVYDVSGNSDTYFLPNLFDFAYYVEFAITRNITIGPVNPGNIVSAVSWINITAMNSNSNVKLYSNNLYLKDDAGNDVTNWPISYIRVKIDTVENTLDKNITVVLNGPGRNINKQVIWNITIPYGISSGQYHFTYTVEINEA